MNRFDLCESARDWAVRAWKARISFRRSRGGLGPATRGGVLDSGVGSEGCKRGEDRRGGLEGPRRVDAEVTSVVESLRCAALGIPCFLESASRVDLEVDATGGGDEDERRSTGMRSGCEASSDKCRAWSWAGQVHSSISQWTTTIASTLL